MKKFIKWLKSPSSDFVLFVLLLILANVAGHNAFKRFDLTSQRSYSLSKTSKSLVKNLEQPLTVRVFFDDKLPSPYNSVAQYIKDILTEYSGAANKNFNIAYMDMSKEDSTELAMDYGLKQVQIQEVKNNEVGFKKAYMGIVISYGDSITLLDPLTSSDGFEYKLTSKISKMVNTQDTLAGLKNNDKVALNFYFTPALKNLGISDADSVENILKTAFDSVNAKNQNRLEFNVINPQNDDEAQTFADKYGIQTLRYRNHDGETKLAVMGAVLEYGDSFRLLPVEIQQSLFGYYVSGLDTAEENISDSLQSLLSKVTQIGYITGHNELDHLDETYSANFDKLISGMYKLVDIDLSTEDIPAGMNSIMINGPQYDYTEEELYKIDQFIMRGGNVMFFIDSMLQDGTASYRGTEQYVPNESNLDRLLQKYGIKREFNYVMDKHSYEASNQYTGKYNLWWAPILQKSELAQKNPITANLGYVIMLQNGSLDVSAAQENKNVKTTVLAKSSPESWTVTNNIQLNPVMMAPPADTSSYKSYDLAVMLEGKFDSAFDEAVKIPVYETDDEGNQVEVELPESDISTSKYINSSIQPGKIFVIGSSYVTTRQLIDEDGTNPIAMMLLNVVDYMNGNEELCKMRTKGLSLSTLTVTSVAAQKVWQYFNEFGLAVIVVIVAFIVWRIRTRRRKAINEKYNPDDKRTVSDKK